MELPRLPHRAGLSPLAARDPIIPAPRVPDEWTGAGVDAWQAAVRHLADLGYDVRGVVPASARRAWRRHRGGCRA